MFVNLEIRTAKIDSTIFGVHLSAEYRVKTEGHGRTVVECKQRPERGNIWRLSTKRRVSAGPRYTYPDEPLSEFSNDLRDFPVFFAKVAGLERNNSNPSRFF